MLGVVGGWGREGGDGALTQVTRSQKELFLFSFYSSQVEGIRVGVSPEFKK